MEIEKEQFITVYKCKGYRGDFLSRTWLQETPTIAKGEERTLAQTLRNSEILDSKEEPYYSELMHTAKLIGISDCYKLREVLVIFLERSKNSSFRREDIDEISKSYSIDAWRDLFWGQKLVRLQ